MKIGLDGMRRSLLRAAVLCLLLSSVAFATCVAPQNAIEAENCKPGNPDTEWDISGAGDTSIQGFATDISYNLGSTARFKIKTDASSYRIDIYRIGYYAGMGARKVATVTPSAALPQTQPACTFDPTVGVGGSGLYDCGNWAVSASWPIPANATSGVYFALLTRNDTGGQSHIFFIVRNDASHSDLLFQTSDTTWQAYNTYGGGSLYGASGINLATRSYKVSYNRPFATRERADENWFFSHEYPLVRWLEANAYDVSYISGVDTARFGSLLLQHKAFLSVGHDEYWSGDQRTNVEAARSAGVHLAFLSANEVFWKTRWENSIDGTSTSYRTLVCYKETHADAKIDPSSQWTGTWRDPRFSPPADGGRPENGLTGTIFVVNGPTADPVSIRIPAEDGKLRFWRNTTVATQPAGGTVVLPIGSLGYEWDMDADNGFRPAGLMRLSSAAYDIQGLLLLDFGNSYGNGSATHHMTLYRAPSGALVFGAGTIRWTWGLDDNHDIGGFPPDVRMQQATVNLFADMGATAKTLQSGLVQTTQSTDSTPPGSAINFPSAGGSFNAGTVVTISGTAFDAGGVVGGVEVSVDGGATWHPANGRSNWTYDWSPSNVGSANIRARAVDDSGNLESAGAGITVTVEPRLCPCNILGNATPTTLDGGDTAAVEVGVKFRSDVNGFITGVRFYKSAANTGTHTGHLWSRDGTLLASATFTGETASGWQQVTFLTAVAVTAGNTYVASYHAPNGRYSFSDQFFAAQGVDNPPLHLLKDGVDGGNGVFSYGASGTFPSSTFRSRSYSVDVVMITGVITAVSPLSGASGVNVATKVSATFDRQLAPASVNNNSFRLLDPANSPVAASVTYDAATSTATLTPVSALIAASSYTATIAGTAGGVTDSSGTPLGLNFSWGFTTCCSMWGTSIVPSGTISSGDAASVNLGVKFRSDVNGFITGLRFYKGPGNIGTHVGHLWTKDGTLLTSATFTNESATGWQQVEFPYAVAVTAGTTYVASYFAPNGRYSVDLDYFATKGADNTPLHFLQEGVDGSNGVFTYGPGGLFPTSSFRSSNYWVDVVFTTTVSSSLGPTVTAIAPASAATGVSVATTVRATFDKPLDPNTVNSNTFKLLDATNSPIDTTVSYDPSTLTTTLQAPFGLEFASLYRVTIAGGATGVKDATGNPMGASVLWLFTTELQPAGTCPCSVLSPSATPAVAASGDANAVELGVKFRSAVSGFVTGLRFYKSIDNIGTHVGHLWTKDGKLLASATFTNESGSGWQQVTFPSAIAITAGTTYVASYFAPNGRYSVTPGQFATAGMDTPPLHFLRDGEDGGNGIFSYGASGTFPTTTFDASYYWVDVIVKTNVGGVFGPSVTAISPGSGAAGVNVVTTVDAAFSKALNPSTVNSSTFQLLDSTNNPVPALVSYDATNFIARLTPTVNLNLGNSYRPSIVGKSGGIKDTAGNSMASNVMWLFTTQPQPPGSCPCFVWIPTTIPSFADSGDGGAVEVGVRFRAEVDGFITGVRFYKGLANTGTHVGNLWTNAGALLASATFTNETASGWQQVTFPAPVAVTAGTTYVASYYAPNGHYSVNFNYFAAAGIDSPPLHLLRDGEDGNNGVFTYGAASAFPTSTFQSSNYWVDVVFESGVPAPAVATVSPASGTSANPGTTVTATFSTAMDPATVDSSTFLLLDQFNAVVPATVTYNSGTNTATLTPTAALASAATYHAVIKGGNSVPRVKNLNGVSLVSDYSWTFSTQGQFSSLAVNPTAVQGGTGATGTVTLTGPAGPGGALIQLSSSHSVVSVPASVTVAAGATTATFAISTSAVSASTPVTITATFDAARTAVLTVNPPAVSGLALNPTTVASGASSTGTVTLNSPAPTGGIPVALSSDNPAASTPASVTIAAGATTGTFTVTTTSVSASTPVTITATLNGTRTAVLTIGAATLSTLTLNPTSVVGGNNSTGTVTLTGVAPAGGALITLGDTNPAATVPATVTIAAGATSATFTVTTTGVSANATGAVSATYSGVTRTANLTVTPAALSTTTLSPATVVGPASSTATLTLTGNAPPGGALVTLSTVNAAASVPASVTIAEGARTATFTVTTVAVATATTGNVSGTYRGTTRSANLTVNPLFASISLSPASVTGGASSTGTITLGAAAPAGGQPFTLSTANTAATVPGSVTVAAGATTATFTVTTVSVSVVTSGNVTASDGLTTRSANLTVNPAGLSSVSRTPASVVGGNSLTGTATLSGAAGPGGAVVTLTTNNTGVVIPASVTIPEGATSVTFTINTVPVTATRTGTVSGTYLGVTRTSQTITVNAPTPSVVTLNPSNLAGGNQSTGTVTLTGITAADTTVALASNVDPAARVSPSVVVPAGSNSASFTINTFVVNGNTNVSISASLNGTTRNATLTVRPPQMLSLTLNPTTVTGGTPSTGTVTLDGPTNSAGMFVNLSSNNTAAATVPVDVLVPAGQRTANFTVTSKVVASTATATITATRGVSRTAVLTVTP